MAADQEAYLRVLSHLGSETHSALARDLAESEIAFVRDGSKRLQRDALRAIERRLRDLERRVPSLRLSSQQNELVRLLGDAERQLRVLRALDRRGDAPSERFRVVVPLLRTLEDIHDRSPSKAPRTHGRADAKTPAAKPRRPSLLRRIAAGGLLLGSLLGSRDVPSAHAPTIDRSDARPVAQRERTPTQLASAADIDSRFAPQIGRATVYAQFFDGRPTASGATFRHDRASCAVPLRSALFNRKHPLTLRITNLENGKSIFCVANDVGNFGYRADGSRNKYPLLHGEPRLVDLSAEAARRLGILTERDIAAGVLERSARVRVEPVLPDRQSAVAD